MNAADRTRIASLVQDKLPTVRIVGPTGIVPHEKVAFIHSIIAGSGIPEKLAFWWAEDHAHKGGGGRPRVVSYQAMLTLLLLVSSEHNSHEIREMGRLVAERLSHDSLELLGLNTTTRTAAGWFDPLRDAFNRIVECVDPMPGRRRKFPTHAEVEAIKVMRVDTNSARKQVRLDWVSNHLLEATMRALPAESFSSWVGDLTVDATVIPAYGKKGAPWSSANANPLMARAAIEYDAAWYLRDAQHNVVASKRQAKKAVFGWDVTLVAMTKHDPSKIADFPQLVLGIGMTKPGTDLIHTARRSFESIVERGHPKGRATGDRGYLASARPEDFQIPLRLMGYDLVTDYKIDQLGVKDGYAGAELIEGAFYCPSMPVPLKNATKDFRAKRISWETWQKRIVQRKQYRLRPKEKPDANGNVPMMCPARGPGATVSCPLVTACGQPKYDSKTPITNPPSAEKRDLICTNKSSVRFPITAGAKLLQTPHFGDEEWQGVYSSDRSTIEGVNAFLKDGARGGIDDATRRRVRGYAAQYLFVSILVATGNLRKIQAYRDELLNHASEEAREKYFERKQLKKDKRKAVAGTRIGAWDDFPEKSDTEREDDGPALA